MHEVAEFTYDNKGNLQQYDVLMSRSKIKCGMLCMKDIFCDAFVYNTATNECSVYTTTQSPSSTSAENLDVMVLNAGHSDSVVLRPISGTSMYMLTHFANKKCGLACDKM